MLIILMLLVAWLIQLRTGKLLRGRPIGRSTCVARPTSVVRP